MIQLKDLRLMIFLGMNGSTMLAPFLACYLPQHLPVLRLRLTSGNSCPLLLAKISQQEREVCRPRQHPPCMATSWVAESPQVATEAQPPVCAPVKTRIWLVNLPSVIAKFGSRNGSIIRPSTALDTAWATRPQVFSLTTRQRSASIRMDFTSTTWNAVVPTVRT